MSFGKAIGGVIFGGAALVGVASFFYQLGYNSGSDKFSVQSQLEHEKGRKIGLDEAQRKFEDELLKVGNKKYEDGLNAGRAQNANEAVLGIENQSLKAKIKQLDLENSTLVQTAYDSETKSKKNLDECSNSKTEALSNAEAKIEELENALDKKGADLCGHSEKPSPESLIISDCVKNGEPISVDINWARVTCTSNIPISITNVESMGASRLGVSIDGEKQRFNQGEKKKYSNGCIVNAFAIPDRAQIATIIVNCP